MIFRVFGPAGHGVKEGKGKAFARALKRPENRFWLNCYIACTYTYQGFLRKNMKFNVQDLMFFLPMIAIIYFMIFLPKKREAQALEKMLGGLKKGDKVLTHSGMFGEVAAIKDK